MAIRGIIAKRISKLKRVGIETPIIDETALPAEVISVEGFFQPSLDVYERIESIRDIIERLKNLPQIAHGTAYGEEAGRWYRVSYPKRMPGATPVAIGVARGGEIPRRTIPKVDDIVSKTIARVTRDDFNSAEYCDLVASAARDRAKELAPPWPLDLLWNWFCDTFVYGVFYVGWYASGWILDSYRCKQEDK